jgi:hypothetical protein
MSGEERLAILAKYEARDDEFAQLVRRLCAEIRASWARTSQYEARLTKSELALSAIWKIAVNTPSRTVEAIGREHADSEAVLP